MKKFVKVSLMISLICTILGIALLGTSAALGLTWDKMVDEFYKGTFTVQAVGKNYQDSYDVTLGDFEEMDIDLAAGEFVLQEGDVESPKISIHGKGIEAYVEDRTLYVESGSDITLLNGKGTVEITLPKGMLIRDFSLDLSAGKATIAPITCVDYDIEMAAGEVNVELSGVEEDYNYNIESAVGEVNVGNQHFSGFGNETIIEKLGARGTVNIDCAAGSINITFAENRNA